MSVRSISAGSELITLRPGRLGQGRFGTRIVDVSRKRKSSRELIVDDVAARGEVGEVIALLAERRLQQPQACGSGSSGSTHQAPRLQNRSRRPSIDRSE